jgi:plasmid stabilization system protein ParE
MSSIVAASGIWRIPRVDRLGKKSRKKSRIEMASKLIIAPEAEQEFLEAFDWYESKQTGLGQRFARDFGECLDNIVRNPLMGQAIRPPYRWSKIRHFPFVVIFDFDEAAVTVYSVFHCSRNPDKWQP